MEASYQPVLSKSIMTALFAGLIASVVCLVYNSAFRGVTHFNLSTIINVSTVAFVVNLLFLVIGFIHYAFVSTFKKGELLYIIAFLLLTAACAWIGNSVHRSEDLIANIQFHHLLASLVVIMGVFASIVIPTLFHSKKFEEHVL